MDSVQLNSEPAVTAISVSARIDYIQRFSKQAVLVIDNEISVYTQAARQFLTNFSAEKAPQESNVAFVSASTKLNDIQMRCRLIEQLFANTLFDPEKSLAVSILKLSKHSKENINIIVEHGHALSLQIKYELCQLVDVANKTENKINVVLFGLEQAAQDVSINKTIFKNKLSIIDAKSGQLFSLENGRFSVDNTIIPPKFWLKLTATVLVITTLVGLSWYALIHYDDFRLSQLPTTSVNGAKSSSATNELNTKLNNDNLLVVEPPLTAKKLTTLAQSADIQAALLGNLTAAKHSKNQQAQVADIVQALDMEVEKNNFFQDIVTEQTIEKDNLKSLIPATSLVNTTEPETVVKNNSASLAFKLTPDYYLAASKGYVVQLVVFTNTKLLSRFVNKYPNLEYFSYQKKMNEHKLIVLTTAIFDTKEQANSAIKTLPQRVVNKGVWVKPLALVQSEINSL